MTFYLAARDQALFLVFGSAYSSADCRLQFLQCGALFGSLGQGDSKDVEKSQCVGTLEYLGR